MEFVGLANFKYLVEDATFWHVAAQHPAHLAAVDRADAVPGAGDRGDAQLGRPLQGFYRIAYFVPNVTSLVAIALFFGAVFATNFGLANAILQAAGPAPRCAWLSRPVGHQDRDRHGDDLAVDRLQRDHLPRRPPDHPRRPLRGGQGRRRRPGADLLPDHAAAAAPGHPLHGDRLDGRRPADLHRAAGDADRGNNSAAPAARPRGPDHGPLLLPAGLRQQRLRLRRRDRVGVFLDRRPLRDHQLAPGPAPARRETARRIRSRRKAGEGPSGSTRLALTRSWSRPLLRCSRSTGPS